MSWKNLVNYSYFGSCPRSGIFEAHMNILFIFEVKIPMLIKWSYMSPSIMLTIKPRMIINPWARSFVSFEHMFLGCLFVQPHLNTYHSNIGVWLGEATKHGVVYLTPSTTIVAVYRLELHVAITLLVLIWKNLCLIKESRNIHLAITITQSKEV